MVCALYIPEVAFGNNRIMEPIVTTKLPRERFSKVLPVERLLQVAMWPLSPSGHVSPSGHLAPSYCLCVLFL